LIIIGKNCSPLNSGFHGHVRDGKGRDHVERLPSKSSPGVEDGGMEGAGERALAVGRYGVGGYAFLGRGTWEEDGYRGKTSKSMEGSIEWFVVSNGNGVVFAPRPVVGRVFGDGMCIG
jgi:hypothetical protein